MGFKPIVHGESIGFGFSEQEKQVFIAVDTIPSTYPLDCFKVFLQIEPPEVFDISDAIIQNKNNFDLILTWNEKILQACSNAILFPFGSCWIEDHTVDIQSKSRAASFLISSKHTCPGHVIRSGIFNSLPSVMDEITITKHRSPPRLPDKSVLLKPYQFSIIMENVRHTNWFTEKLIDCFICKTIPIYYGAPNINEFFDIGGIFTFTTNNELLDILNNRYLMYAYPSLIASIQTNYQKALAYTNIWKRVDKIIQEKII